MAAPRRRKIVSRRRVDDEGDEDYDLDDDSLTEGSLVSDDHDLADDSDTSNVDEASPTSPAVRKAHARAANGHAKARTSKVSGSSATQPGAKASKLGQTTVSDTEFMMNGLSISDKTEPVQEMNFEDVGDSQSPSKAAAPVVVSSSSAVMDQTQDNPLQDRRRREHDEYRRKRDEDPAFVPNRGAFFMHDHRHAGPSANGFRPFGRGGRGRGRGIGGPFAPSSSHQIYTPADPIISTPWAHDMHETVTEPVRPVRQPMHGGQTAMDNGPPNGDGYIPTCDMSATPINRTLSTEKHIGNVQVRVYLPMLKQPIVFSTIPVRQYTKLPDHRPPLRRDKPVRISLPDYPPRYIFPATDRSFIFIPRALRPNNQQRLRGKPRSGFGSLGGYSRRTSVFGGSYYNGSQYSPSVALSRRSSIAPDMGREYIVSPAGSAISRPPMAMDTSRPVVRLPPQTESQMTAFDASMGQGAPAVGQTTISDLPQPQTHPLPQKPAHQESQHTSIPMHQPRPQKTVSLENIEPPTMMPNSQPYQQAFHHQVPVQVSNGFNHDSHTRHPSYARHTTGTPLSQIPERAIHAAPFQPTHYSQQGYYPPYQMAQPQGYYYPPATPYSGAAPTFVPGTQPPQGQNDSTQSNGQLGNGASLVAQEVNGMVYYYDASQLPQMPSYPQYPASQGYPTSNGAMSINGMVTPTQDGYYYPQPGAVYYPQ
ncbi:putative CASC3/Barentsz eIF4AIII binding-domain-containing protein [Seiridium cardinale]|uniref:CASC3/Barentsz eIF4AIII binding-domain-containing protein n=1 Tax=Seiridium cardinale TaxID=138064 RepID=A0ABR2Y7Z1_9PEZI